MWIKKMVCVDNVDNFVNSDKIGILVVDKIVEKETVGVSNWDGHLLTGGGISSPP